MSQLDVDVVWLWILLYFNGKMEHAIMFVKLFNCTIVTSGFFFLFKNMSSKSYYVHIYTQLPFFIHFVTKMHIGVRYVDYYVTGVV